MNTLNYETTFDEDAAQRGRSIVDAQALFIFLAGIVCAGHGVGNDEIYADESLNASSSVR